MSGYREDLAVPGPSTPAKPVQLSADRIAKELDNEREALSQLRSVVQQQLRVLQAEDVTIQRLIHHHSRSSKSPHDHRKSRSHSYELEPESGHKAMETPYHDRSSNQLPQLDLDVTSMPSAQNRSADVSEEENESEVESETANE